MSWSGRRWRDRRLTALLLRAAVFLVPILVGVAAGTLLASALPAPSGWAVVLGWWIAVIAVSLGALFVVDRLARRLLPLAALLRLSLVFPDQAPSRFGIMLRANSTKSLQRRVAEARAEGIDDDPTRAAEVVLSLAAELNRHDRLTRGHAERTRAYTDLLAEELGLSTEEMDRLRWAALLHDVGKLEIASDVLNAERGLDDDEWAALREHPRLGFELTKPIHEFLGEWAETIAHHHERWDGAGYPAGLAREDIAYGARIVAVADAYDAMTAFRSYRPLLSPAEARLELADGAGEHFDPTVVRAFLSVSIGKLRRIAGPLALLGQLPFTGGLRRLGDAAGAAVSGLAVLLAVAAAGVGLMRAPSPSLADLFAAFGADSVTLPVVRAGGDGQFDPRQVDATTARLVSDPRYGTVAIDGDGRVTYVPGDAFAGGDAFTVEVCDRDGDCVFVPLVARADGVVALGEGVVAAPPTSEDPVATSTRPAPIVTSAPPVTPGVTATATPATSPPTSASSLPPSSTPTSTGSTTTGRPSSPPSSPPAALAADDVSWTLEDESVTVDVLANDRDPDGSLRVDSLRVVSAPARGDVVVAAGKLMYFPDAHTYGSDAFGYEVCGTSGRCGTARVAVAVAPVNDAPEAVADEAVGQPGRPLTIAVAGNDRDVDGDVLTVVDHAAASALGGTVTCTSSVCTYTPPAVWTGPDTFQYTVADPAGKRSTATVTVTPEVVDVAWTLTAAGPGDQPARAVLPLVSGATAAVNTSVPNLDRDRDGRPGLLLQAIGTGIGTQLAESDPTRYQMWRAGAGEALTLQGEASLDLAAAMADFQANEAGMLRVFVLDCPASSTTGADCVRIAEADVARDPWSSRSGVWQKARFSFGLLDSVIAADRALALKVVVAGSGSHDDMRLAFDTVGYEAVFTIRS
jgi:hypothetical protein